MSSLDQIAARLRPELTEMNAIISRSLATDNAMMNHVVTSFLRTKGKQIRPLMVILSAKLLGEVNDHVLYAGAALEMLHNASLIHDDVVDETMLRRGVPTINSEWGNHVAVLVGDFFVSNALAAGIHTGRISIISALSALGCELSLGEIDQIVNARDHHFDEESYLRMIGKKTASLFCNCVRMGAEAIDVPEERYAPLVEYARLLGLCFQIKDDIFDYSANELIGKPTGNDLREGKVTLPLLYSLRTAAANEADRMKTLIMGDTLSDAQIATLLRFAIDNGGIDYAYSFMRGLQRRASELLEQYPASEWRSAFAELFEFIISRDK